MSRRKFSKNFADMVRVLDRGKRHYKDTYVCSFCSNYDDWTLHRHFK